MSAQELPQNAPPVTVHIAQMGQHFLYLPLYYACSKRFFDLVPANYSVRVVTAEEKTDESAFRMLMDDDLGRRKDVLFAVCDPTVILDRGNWLGRVPQLLGALVTNAAFWAVDRGTLRSELLEDLAEFESVISFRPGTTSHAIATKILHIGRARRLRPIQIRSVDPGEELIELKRSPNTIALSPDILGVDDLIDTDESYKIEFELAKTPDFSGMIATALITRHDVSAKHPELVRGVVHALQRALIEARLMTPDFLKYAEDLFQRRSATIASALRRANESEVFPPGLEVHDAAWMHTARAAYESKGEKWNTAARQDAQEIAKTAILQCKPIAAAAFQQFMLGAMRASAPAPRPVRKLATTILFSAALLLSILVFFLPASGWMSAVTQVLAVWIAATAVPHLLNLQHRPLGQYLGATFAATVTLALWILVKNDILEYHAGLMLIGVPITLICETVLRLITRSRHG